MIGILVVLLVLFMAMGVAEEERRDASGQWKYVLEDGGATITGCVEKPSGELIIPGELDGHAVTGVGNEAFASSNGFTEIIIPSSVISIGKDAFQRSNNLVLTVEEGSYAGQYAKENAVAP